MLSGWWEKWGWGTVSQPPLYVLPKTGYISNDVAAGFLYLTNSSLCWLEWVVVNPEADKISRNESIDEVIKFCIAVAKESNSSSIFSSTRPGAFVARLKDHGFKESDLGMTNLVCNVGDK